MRKLLSWLLIAVMAISMCAFASAEEAAVDKIDFADGAAVSWACRRPRATRTPRLSCLWWTTMAARR